MRNERLFVLGGTGFVGAEAIREAVARGWEVRALARTEDKAERLRALGAIPVRGDARAPREWIAAARGAAAVVDLVQPAVPARIRRKDIEAISEARQAMTRELVASLLEIPPEDRPWLLSVSGTDDLAAEASGRIDGASPVKWPPTGFAHVGVPVRRIVERAGIRSAFVYLGTVYGPGKSFATTVFPRLARGTMRLPRGADGRLPLVHVRDAGRAIVHLVSLGGDRVTGRSWIVVDPAGGARLGEFFEEAARCMGVAPPRRAPAWLLSRAMGKILFETLTRDVRADSSDLLATGFRFTVPTIREGLPATLRALGYRGADSGASHADRRARRRRFLVLLAITLASIVTVNTVDLPLSAPGIRELAGGEPILDLRLGYTPRAAYRLLDALGAVGRGRYLRMLWTVDLVLPALFTAFLWSAVSRGALRRWRWIAVCAGAADYLENATITALLRSYPAHHDGLARLASALTVSKLSLYVTALLLAARGGWRPRRPDVRARAADQPEPHPTADRADRDRSSLDRAGA